MTIGEVATHARVRHIIEYHCIGVSEGKKSREDKTTRRDLTGVIRNNSGYDIRGPAATKAWVTH